jgi:hypothetical protein
LPLVLVAALLVIDGLRGPQVGALNLAGVVPWIHYRGFAILGLLAASNVSCMACPFLVPRTLARRWLPSGRRWPRALRSKWLAVAVIAAYLWAYEALALWDRPAATAVVIAGYFAAAFVVDGLFRGAAFCKYLCPIGQFNFVTAQVAPLEVAVREPETCARCRTHDCIRGSGPVPGCELGLFQPRKAGNLDCTFCLDCVHACPHGNVGILAGAPGRDLVTPRNQLRSGLGRLSRRTDIAALVFVVVFGGFANAAGMVAPVLEAEDWLRRSLGLSSPIAVTSVYYVATLIVLPLLLLGLAAALGRRCGGIQLSARGVATQYAYALVPLGVAIWLAHLGFHLFTSYGTIVPTAQRFAIDNGWRSLGAPAWSHACCLPVAGWMLRAQLTALDLGLLLSLYTAYRTSITLVETPEPGRAFKAMAPWAVVIAALFALGVWIVLQPMQMRGTLPGAG